MEAAVTALPAVGHLIQQHALPDDVGEDGTGPEPAARLTSGLVARGAAWTAATSLFMRVANIAITAVVARILSPSDFGVFALAMAVFVVISALAELGLGSAIARSAREPDDIAPTVTTLAIVVSTALSLVLFVGAAPLATVVGAPEATAALRILSLSLFLTGLLAVPSAQLVREFRQDRVFIATCAGFVPGNVALVVLALDGNGAEAFAWSRVVGQLVTGIVLVASLRKVYRPGLRPSLVRGLLLFGLPLAAANLVNWALLSADYVILGRLMNPELVGTYMLAFSVAGWSTAVLGPVLNNVVIPSFARVGDAPAQRASAMVVAVQLVGMLALPVGAVLVALAGPLVGALYGPTWTAAAIPLAVLAVYGALFAFCLLSANLLISQGHTGRLLIVQLVWIALLVPTMVWAARFGLLGVAWVHVGVVCTVVLPCYWVLLRRRYEVTLRTLGRALLPMVAAAVSAGLVARLVSTLLPSDWLSLLGGGLAAVLAYAVVLVPLVLWSSRDQADPRLPGVLVARRALRGAALAAQRTAASLPDPLRRFASRCVPSSVRPSLRAAVGDWSTPLVGSHADGLADLALLRIRSGVKAPPASSRPGVRPGASADRVTLVTGSLDVGGMDDFVVFLARGLADRGRAVHVAVASNAPEEVVGRAAGTLREEGFGVSLHRTSADLAAGLADSRPAAVSLHGAPDWAVRAAAGSGIPVVETLHGMHTLYWAEPAALAARVSGLSRVVAVSELARQQFLGLLPSVAEDFVVTIPNGVWSREREPWVRARAREACGLTDEVLFLSLARHCLQKNTFGLVDAFEDVAVEVPDAHLLVAGRPDDAAYFAQVHARATASPAADRIHLRDHHPDPSLLYAAADCFVLDSFFEGWSLASMEALTAGLPVVLSDVGGAREQLAVDPSPGHLVPNPAGDALRVDWTRISAVRFRRQENRDELVRAMAGVAMRREHWAADRARIARESGTRFAPAACLDRHLQLLDEVAAPQPLLTALGG